MHQERARISPWRLRYDLVWTHVLLRVARAGGRGEAKPEVHLYFADRYWRLADYYRHHGSKAKAVRSTRKAEWHYAQAGLDKPPPAAAAMAMPVPRPPIFTDARGRSLDHAPPDDAA